jgi:2-dehydro-3-deoxygluconokinase
MNKIIPNEKKDFDLLGLGEVLLRLSPPDKERILNCYTFDKRAGGSELNVVSGVSLLGLRSGIITKLPDNEIGKFIKNSIRFSGVSDDYIIYDKEKKARLGLYYYESGAAPRKPVVVYDRNNSSFQNLKVSELDPDLFKKARLFHVSGITLGLSDSIREETKNMISLFKKNQTLISFDVNYRAALWDEKKAFKEISGILNLIDFLFISEETCRRMFSKQGKVEEILKGFAEEFGCGIVAASQRKVISPARHSWNSIIYDSEAKDFFSEEPYNDIEVIDRIGSGDAYLAGVLFGILKFADLEKALEFGNAMASIKNTIPGDMPVSDLQEILRVIKEHKEKNSGEMIR